MAEHAGGWSQRVRQWWRQARRWGVLGALAVAGSAAAADAIPAHWMAYANLTSETLAQQLARADDPRVERLQAWLAGRGEAATATLTVSLWIDENGRITDSRFVSLGDAAVDADLRGLLNSAPLPSAPPADMRQPLNLGLSLQPAVDAPSHH